MQQVHIRDPNLDWQDVEKPNGLSPTPKRPQSLDNAMEIK